ncbi:hypothetical protein Tpen_0954 [Thermofilum pendens Hrk 5]|uniref:Uncharacterized protein n=1 Tax=Thermofilum pendens (strain DSM 2475 / Hrk 5) TaxID=368408 RepID=A1RYS4_THEPD|nr:hypothetical protein Tpen_0954 [Thermofilum pendens Hrk 5]
MGLDRYAELAELAGRMRGYFENVVTAVNFFTYGMLTGAYFSVVWGFPELWEYRYAVLAGFTALMVVAYAVTSRFASRAPRVEVWRWVASFLAPLPVFYVVAVATGSEAAAASAWYLYVGLFLLLVYVSFGGAEWSKPFLVASSTMLATYPAVLYLSLARGYAANLVALGLMLASYYAAGIYALRRAHRALEGGVGG